MIRIFCNTEIRDRESKRAQKVSESCVDNVAYIQIKEFLSPQLILTAFEGYDLWIKLQNFQNKLIEFK